VSFDDLARPGGYRRARAAGLIRSEGRDDVAQDGEVLLFRFSV
jgi:ribosome-binding ATPase YchF (GTP1/OBG family)